LGRRFEEARWLPSHSAPAPLCGSKRNQGGYGGGYGDGVVMVVMLAVGGDIGVNNKVAEGGDGNN
jgi:hypothetical protein